jgi:hypothetical protein
MGIGISKDILGLTGQRVNEMKLDQARQTLVLNFSRDRRRKTIDPLTGKKGAINRYVRRRVRDMPLDKRGQIHINREFTSA